MSAQIIEEMRERIDTLEQNLKRFLATEHEGVTFGPEKEYTASELKSELKYILFILSAMIEYDEDFIALSDKDKIENNNDEIGNISAYLHEINQNLIENNYDKMAYGLNGLKPIVRKYALDSKILLKLIETFKNRANELDIMISKTQENVDETEKTRKKTEAAMEDIDEKTKLAESKFDDISQKITQLEDQSQQINILQEKSKNESKKINELLITSNDHKEAISNFAEQIQQRENELKSQSERTKLHDKKLAEYEVEFKEWKKRCMTEAEDLIKKCREALDYATARTVSAAFASRYRYERHKNNIWWLVIALAASVTAGIVGYFLVAFEQNITVGAFLGRIAVMSVAISIAWFCASQYVKSKNIQEDYGYKSALAKSIMPFLDQFDDEERRAYLQMVLMQIHQDPLRKKHDVDMPISKILNMFGRNKKEKNEKNEEDKAEKDPAKDAN